MNLLLRFIVAVVVALIVAGILNYLHVLTPGLNNLIGFLFGLVTFFSYDGRIPGRRVL